jgi:predicted small metal-binding protein
MKIYSIKAENKEEIIEKVFNHIKNLNYSDNDSQYLLPIIFSNIENDSFGIKILDKENKDTIFIRSNIIERLKNIKSKLILNVYIKDQFESEEELKNRINFLKNLFVIQKSSDDFITIEVEYII